MPGRAEDCGTTLVSAVSGYYTWKIHNFKDWLKSSALSSPSFVFPDIHSCPWELKLQKSTDHKDYLGICLSLSITSHYFFEASISFTSWGKQRMCKHSATHTFKYYCSSNYCSIDTSISTGYYFAKFLHESLIDDLLLDGTLTIYCVKKQLSSTQITSKMEDFQNVADPSLKILIDLNNLLKSGKFSDMVITSSCGKKFEVHKNILAARSAVFSAMFENDMKETTENLVEITDIDAGTLEELLLFIYTGKVNNLKSAVSGLLPAADKYAIEDLKIMCEKVLNDNIDVDNAVDVLVLADLHHANLLKQRALSFITKHLKSVMETPAFKNLMNGTHPHLSEILTAIAETN